jgi:hypothetical protein
MHYTLKNNLQISRKAHLVQKKPNILGGGQWIEKKLKKICCQSVVNVARFVGLIF